MVTTSYRVYRLNTNARLQGMHSKFTPHIPPWAHWIAQDEDGSWWAFEAEPHLAEHSWYENEVGRIHRLGKSEVEMDWRNSLIKTKDKN